MTQIADLGPSLKGLLHGTAVLLLRPKEGKEKNRIDREIYGSTAVRLPPATTIGLISEKTYRDATITSPLDQGLHPLPEAKDKVKSLERRAAELEAQVLAFRAAPQNVPNSMASIIGQATISYGVPSTPLYLRSLISSSLIFRPSCPPLAILRELPRSRRDEREAQNETAVSPQARKPKTPSSMIPHSRANSNTIIDLSSVPSSAIRRMVQNYAENHLPQYPCIPETKLADIVDKTLSKDFQMEGSSLAYGSAETAGLGHFEYFVLFIVLAISTMTLTWTADNQARSASESFYNSALVHLQSLEVDSEMMSLQVSLLLAHYAQMRPERVDNWPCIANAVRTALALGLFKEPPPQMDTEQALQRAKLFWVTYGMERSLCTILRLPLSFPEEIITVRAKVLANEQDAFAMSTNDVDKRSSANQIRKYRALETEVHRVMHLGEDVAKFGSPTLEGWVHDLDGRLHEWYMEAKKFTKHGMLEFKHIQFYHLRIRLYRPTPRMKTRTAEDRRIVLESARCVIEDYLGQEGRRRLFYPWHALHILFETVVVGLEACWTSLDWQPLNNQILFMVQVLVPQCLQIIRNIGQGWSGAAACVERLKPLADKIATAVVAWNNNQFLDGDMSITEEINGLLFSEGALTGNVVDDSLFGFDDISTLLGGSMAEDLEFFQWDPSWGVLPADPTYENEFQGGDNTFMTPDQLGASILADLASMTEQLK
ncbi:uncharacterized protein E0L32_009087 [Thyridium curvatum]|uniref:Xylanolytic transcriptional activator regulatory domain-containing protein n=1 Tax=Thyridium curvatum TaxID=1093900 RepID=A0A507AY57_9PEZI|nr:uncharacterized protein E0L32_009087 [Thyridium curvatum]TPX09748.1 hypothetical protein E0L32_009087 [Thyridium curvatum]